MSLLARLADNKGTISSSLGKQLAQEVLDGDRAILDEAIALCSHDPENVRAKNVRAGAAKTVEKVAEVRPELVAGRLDDLKSALHVAEPQTRWMVLHVCGLCASLNPQVALGAVDSAREFLEEDAGICLTASATRFLGDIGALSEGDAEAVFPDLERLLGKASLNEVDWVLESLEKIASVCSESTRQRIAEHAARYLDSPKAAQRKRASKVIKAVEARS